jgi:hypothetical protein
MSTDTGIEAAWSHATSEIAATGLDAERIASETQRAAIAAALDLLALERLEVHYHIAPLPAGRYRLDGVLDARVVQACVVTLDPVATDIREELAVEFLPSPQLPEADSEEQGILDTEDHEPIENERLGVGRVAFETLAAALPPYPRSDDAALEKHEAAPATGDAPGPFSALAGWKPKRD